MNDQERSLIRFICDGDIKHAQQQVRIILNGINSKKDEDFKERNLQKLDEKMLRPIDIPYNLQHILVAEDSSKFPESRFLLRPEEKEIVNRTIAVYRVAQELQQRGIPYVPALILHGESGCGKTMLARYIAHQAELPFLYVRFANLIDSLLGKTQTNIGLIFHFVRSNPCVLCFDEIDAIGMARGQDQEVGEMARIVIALMQEMDSLPSNLIVVGTTNRFDRLDKALVRRFPFQYEVKPLRAEEIVALAEKFFAHAGVDGPAPLTVWCNEQFGDSAPASSVVTACTEWVVAQVIAHGEAEIEERDLSPCAGCTHIEGVLKFVNTKQHPRKDDGT